MRAEASGSPHRTAGGLPRPDLALGQAGDLLGLDEPRGHRHDLSVLDDHLREGKPRPDPREVAVGEGEEARLPLRANLHGEPAGGLAEDDEGEDRDEVFHNYQHNGRGRSNVQIKVKLF